MNVAKFEYHFLQEISSLATTEATILVAVSGGVDSMVLLDLLCRHGYQVAVAHCNYQLRGQDSEEDAAFVEDVAATYKIPFHLHTVDLKQLLLKKNKAANLQETARQIRYDFFGETALQQGYDRIALAHHQQDNVESFLINMLRGSGLGGLVSMQAQNGIIVRPLLFASKAEILEYAQSLGLKWREDASNAKDEYLRNKIRHQIVPALEKIQPNFQKRWSQNIAQLKMAHDWMTTCHEQWVSANIQQFDQGFRVPVTQLQAVNLYPLFVLFSKYGFNFKQIDDIVHQISTKPYANRNWKSPTHLAVQESTYVEISHINKSKITNYPVQLDQNEEFSFQDFTFQLKGSGEVSDSMDPSSVIFLDAAFWNEELVLRNRQAGDYIKPEGMQGRQKIKHLLINEKYSRAEKDAVVLLACGSEILWIVGKRRSRKVADRTATTKAMLLLRQKKREDV